MCETAFTVSDHVTSALSPSSDDPIAITSKQNIHYRLLGYFPNPRRSSIFIGLYVVHIHPYTHMHPNIKCLSRHRT